MSEKESSAVISMEEYHRRRDERLAQRTPAKEKCRFHDLIVVSKEETVTVRFVAKYGEKIETCSIPEIQKCIKCGRVDTYEGFYPAPYDDCFIATASYGSRLAPQLHILRRFRDDYLPSKLVRIYYRVSPQLASRIRTRDGLRMVIRGFLEVLVFYLRFYYSKVK